MQRKVVPVGTIKFSTTHFCRIQSASLDYEIAGLTKDSFRSSARQCLYYVALNARTQEEALIKIEIFDEIPRPFYHQHSTKSFHLQNMYRVMDARRQLGAIHYTTKNYSRSIEAYMDYLNLAILMNVERSRYSEFSLIWNYIGLSYFQMGLMLPALDSFLESLKFSLGSQKGGTSDGMSSIAFYNAAFCLKEMKYFEPALRYFKEAFYLMSDVTNWDSSSMHKMRINFDTTCCLEQVCEIYNSIGRMDDAIIYFQDVLHTTRTNFAKVAVLNCICYIRKSQGNFHEAQMALDEASMYLTNHIPDDDDTDQDMDDTLTLEDLDFNAFTEALVSSYLTAPKCAPAA